MNWKRVFARLDSEVQEAVLKVLQTSDRGFAQVTASHSVRTGLPWWKRAFNRLASILGADQPPFIDPLNFTKCEVIPLSQVADPGKIDRAMRELAKDPTCKICGGTDLVPDPAGYYCHAEDYRGAPLLCMNQHHQ